ncbi:MAG: hypothetical protein [Bacteriophage sp.]|nr:MAG: hypothetical protein [Bacteriophage sp.]
MARPKIPYDLLHELESKFGSIGKVPENNPILINIRKILSYEDHIVSKKIYLKSEINELLDKGYMPTEIAEKLMITIGTVRRSMRMFDMKTKPRFRYKIVNQATGESIYGNVCQDFSRLINVNCSSFKLAKSYLSLEGYKLTKCDPRILWGELKKGQKYYQNGQLKVKK